MTVDAVVSKTVTSALSTYTYNETKLAACVVLEPASPFNIFKSFVRLFNTNAILMLPFAHNAHRKHSSMNE